MLTEPHADTGPKLSYRAPWLLSALVVALLALVAAAPGARAATGWSTPVTLSDETSDGYDAQVAVDPQGDAVASWMQCAAGSGCVVQVATRPAGGAWSAPATLSSPGVPASEPAVAIDAKGDAIVAWKQYVGADEIEASTHAAGAVGWDPAETLSNPLRESTTPQVAIDPTGQAVVVFTGDDAVGTSRIQATAEQGFGGLWGAPIMLSAAGQNAEEPTLAVDAAGEAIAAWSRLNGSEHIVQEAARSTNGVWSTPINLSIVIQDGSQPRVAVDAAGDAAITWIAYNGNGEFIDVSTRTATGAWSGARSLTGQTEEAREPRVAVDGGDALVVWSQIVNGDFVVRSSSAAIALGTWSAPTDLSPSMPEEPELAPAVDPAGDGMVVFEVEEGGTEVMQAVTRAGASGPWSAPVTISTPGALSTQPQLAFDGAGEATAVWRTVTVGAPEVIQSATYDPADAGSAGEASPGGTPSTPPTVTDPSISPPVTEASAPPASTEPAKTRCPKGKTLRKVRVRLHSNGRTGAKGKSKPKFKAELRCLAPAPHHQKKSTEHHRPREN